MTDRYGQAIASCHPWAKNVGLANEPDAPLWFVALVCCPMLEKDKPIPHPRLAEIFRKAEANETVPLSLFSELHELRQLSAWGVKACLEIVRRLAYYPKTHPEVLRRIWADRDFSWHSEGVFAAVAGNPNIPKDLYLWLCSTPLSANIRIALLLNPIRDMLLLEDPHLEGRI